MADNKRSFGAPQAVLLVVLFVLLSILFSFLAQYILERAGWSFVDTNLVLIISNSLATLLVVLVGLRRYGLETGLLRMRPLPVVHVLPIVVSIIGLVLLESVVLGLVQDIWPMPDVYFELFADSPLPLVLFTVCVMAPVTEELLFRGVVLGGLRHRFGAGNALVLSALLFGLVHLNPVQFVGGFLAGLLFGWWYLRSGNLVHSMLGHALMNLAGVLALRFAPEETGVEASQEVGLWQYAWVVLVGALLLGLGLRLSRRMMGRAQ